ncbi:hypothetical protein PINS_up017871 [Pythium insidiosum]|nr:hypothetical protein PINS_up017871 [Pythium insidiosum]
MSNWTKDEVDALKEENGGGNAVARRVWLGRWDESKLRKPHEGDHIDVYKRFIDKVYNDKLFYDEDGARSTSTRASNDCNSSNSSSSHAASSGTSCLNDDNANDCCSSTYS